MAESVVVVTGGGRGIGRAICKRFGAEAFQVVATARSEAELKETQAMVERAGGQCHVHAADLRSVDAVNELMSATVERFAHIDVLVNNAGIAPMSTIEDLSPELFEAIRIVNIDAVYLTCKAVWPTMKKQKAGVIVNISSVASVDPFPGFTAYGASKAWVNVWTKALADEGRPLGIRVFAVAPGAVETSMLRGAFPDFPADQALDPKDVASLVYTMTQPACFYATGQTIFTRRAGD